MNLSWSDLEADSGRNRRKDEKMRNRQRWLAILLTGCMILAAGCGSASTESGKSEESLSEAAAVQKEETAKDDSAENGGSSEEMADAEKTGVPQIHIRSNNLDKYSEDGSTWLLHAEYDTLAISGDGYEALGRAAAQWSEQNEESIQALAEEYAGYAEEESRGNGEYQDYDSYSIYDSLTLARTDTRVVSLLELNSEYTGGAHGNYGFAGVNFDAQTGALLKLEDILTDEEGFQEKAAAYMIGELDKTYGEGLFPGYEDTVKAMWQQEPVWYMDGAGITFVFNPYEVGPYAMGEARVLLPYEEFSEYLKEAYLPDRWEGVYLMPENADVTASLPLSSFSDNAVRLNTERNEEYDETKIYLTLNGQQTEPETFARIDKAYLISTGGFSYVILDGDYASDDFGTFLYDISTGVIRESDYLENAGMQTHSVVNTEGLTLRVNLNVLGTYSAQMDYIIDRDGKLVQQEAFFRMIPDSLPYRILTTVKELPAVIEDGEVLLPVGSRIRITATDNVGIAQFRDEDTKAEGDIRFTRGDGEDAWIIYIDGIPDTEYFESVPYAG